jgi:intracellular sulfur oxidation DsrE/DsrF family protein
MYKTIFILGLFLITTTSANAGKEKFSKGPVFHNYGENTAVENGLDSPQEQKFKVVFDVSERAKDDAVNQKLNTVARFINMHARAGVPLENMDVAVVVHGKASFDLTHNKAHNARFKTNNPSNGLLNALLNSGVEVYICGQSAAFSDIAASDLNPRVQMSLSAMTANALLQQRGFTLNPF